MDDALKLQLNNLQLSRVTSTDKVIGRGAYGRAIEVYVHGTLCAAKEIHPALVENVSAQESETIRRSFCEECVKASRIHHPNIVQMLGIYYPTPQAKLPWLVMEMMQTSLKDFLEKYKQGKVPLHFKLSMLVDVAQGLEFLHGQNIIHRDLSSNNVLLTKNLIAKIADLGVAKVVQENKIKTHTQAPGTIHFMPPETLLNKPRYGKPVDVFSLACVVLHVMSHQWPEPKDLFLEGTMTALKEMERRDEYITFCTHPALKELVELCLHNKPEQRPEISAVCEKLKELKVTIEKQIPFATDNNFELFDVVRQVNIENQKLTTANKKLTVNAAQLEEKDQQIRERDNQLQEKDNQLCDKDQQIQKRDDQLRKEDQELQEKDQQIRKRDDQLREKDQQIQKRDDQLRKKDQEIRSQLLMKDREMDKQIQEMFNQLQERYNQLQEKDRKRDDQLEEKSQQIQDRDDQLRHKDQEIQEKDQQIRKRDAQLREKDQQIQKRDDQLHDKDQEIQKKDRRIRERDNQLHDKDQEIQEKDQEIRVRDDRLREKDQQIRERDNQLHDKDQEIQEKDQQIRKRDEQLREKDQQIRERDDQLRETDQQVDQKIMELQSANICSFTSKHHKEMVPASKFGKIHLKNRLQHKKEVTQTVVQTGGDGTHSQAISNYANADDPPKGGGLHSLSSVTVSTSDNADQLRSSSRVYKRQASIPNDTSLSGGSDKMAGISTSSTTSNNQLAVSDNNAVLIAAVPITDQPTPETSQAPPDSKYGKTNLNALKNRLQHKKEVTQIAAQGGSADYTDSTTKPIGANLTSLRNKLEKTKEERETTKLDDAKAALTSLKNRLEKTKEEREKTLIAGNVNADEDYCNIEEFAQYKSENPVMINNPPNKRPMAVPQTVTPANHGSNDPRSVLSASLSNRTYRLWQCANCQTVNEVHHTMCETCKLLRGKMADNVWFCDFCQLMIFLPVKRGKEICCPRCKHVFESAL